MFLLTVIAHQRVERTHVATSVPQFGAELVIRVICIVLYEVQHKVKVNERKYIGKDRFR